MTGLSSAGEAAVLSTLVTTAYISLHIDDPGDTGINEVTGGSYARQGPVTFGPTGNNPTVGGNSGIVTYPIATAAWGPVSYFGLWTAPTGGTFQGSGVISPGKSVNNGDQVRFPQGSLTVTVQ